MLNVLFVLPAENIEVLQKPRNKEEPSADADAEATAQGN
jgi:hypothetical protein